MAALAVSTAPGWRDEVQDEQTGAQVERLIEYLRTTELPHDYARVLLLWAATRMPDLIDESRQSELIDTVWKHQRADGGWSMRTFAEPEQWGQGNRTKRLLRESDRADPPSDGHMTGLAILVLRDAGIPSEDKRIQQGVAWLLANQRDSGRWWARSLNTNTFHYITFSSTAYALSALAKCGAF